MLQRMDWVRGCALALLLGGGIGAAARAQNVGASTAPMQEGVQVLSDTKGVDFEPYLRRLQNDIQHNWNAVIPAKANPPESKKGAVGILFTILPDGRIGSMKLEHSSGDAALDKAGWYAITSEGTFPALPSEFHGPLLELRVGFFYNYNTPVKN